MLPPYSLTPYIHCILSKKINNLSFLFNILKFEKLNFRTIPPYLWQVFPFILMISKQTIALICICCKLSFLIVTHTLKMVSISNFQNSELPFSQNTVSNTMYLKINVTEILTVYNVLKSRVKKYKFYSYHFLENFTSFSNICNSLYVKLSFGRKRHNSCVCDHLFLMVS